MAGKGKKKAAVGYKLSEDERLKKQAYGIAMFGTAEVYHDQVSYTSIGRWPDRFEVIPAPTSDKSGKPDKRPRALECAYDKETETLFIAFRQKTRKIPGTGIVAAVGLPPIIEYRDVPEEIWENLKQSDSTGKFLKYSGLDAVATKNDEVKMDELHRRFPKKSDIL